MEKEGEVRETVAISPLSLPRISLLKAFISTSASVFRLVKHLLVLCPINSVLFLVRDTELTSTGVGTWVLDLGTN